MGAWPDLDETMLRAVVEETPDALLVLDRAGAVLGANPAGRRLLAQWLHPVGSAEPTEAAEPAQAAGTAGGDGLPAGLVDALPEASRPSLKEALTTVEQSSPLIVGPLPFGGDAAPCVVHLSVLGDGRLLARLVDLGPAPLETEQLRALLDAAPDALVVVDTDGRIVLVNQQLGVMFGYAPDELLGRSVDVLVPIEQRGVHEHLRGQYLRRPTKRPMGTTRRLFGRRRDGSEVPVEISLSPVRTTGGVVVATAIRDVSPRVAREEEAERMRDELLATISHELRTPLTSIVGFLEFVQELEDDELGPQARHMLGIIERNAHRELRLVNNLLDLATVDVSRAALAKARLDLAELVPAAVTAMVDQVTAAGLTLRVLDVRGPLPVVGDLDRLVQVVEQVVSNAVKFNRPGGRIDLTVGRDGPEAWFEIADDGTGIAQADLPKVFDRMYRTQDAVRDQVPGAGLGLTLVRSIVGAHSGRVEIASTLGAGTTLRVTVPISEDAVEPGLDVPVAG